MIDTIKNVVHFTHNDGDAVGCALVAALAYTQSDLINNTHFLPIGQQNEYIKDWIENNTTGYIDIDIIIVSDISVSEEVCEILEEYAYCHKTKLIGIDHHQTNGLSEKHHWWQVESSNVFDILTNRTIKVSASYLMLRELRNLFIENLKNMCENTFGGLKIFSFLNILINMISDYDTWEWQGKNKYSYQEKYICSEDVIPKVCYILGPQKVFEYLFELYYEAMYNNKTELVRQTSIVPSIFLDIHDTIIENEQKAFEAAKYKAHYITNDKGISVFYPLDDIQTGNATMNYINKNYNVRVVVGFSIGNMTISLRSINPDVNCGEICKEFGGGGHPGAGGTKNVSKEIMTNVIKYYLEAPTLEELETKEDINVNEKH